MADGPIIALCALLLAAGPAPAAEPCQLTIAQLKYGGGGDWYGDPSALPNLVKAVKQQTPVRICDTVATTEIMADDFFHYPFVWMTGHGNVHFTLQERLRLRTFLAAGGFLWADDCYGMDKSFRREMKALFPENPLTLVPLSHPIYSSVHKLPNVPKVHEHDGEPAQGLGIFFKDRLVVFYTYSADIGDGMEDLDVHKDGPDVHANALKMGVNIVAWFMKP